MTWNCCQNRSPKSRNRVQCQWMTVAKWPLWVPACLEKVPTQPLRRQGCLHTHKRMAHKGQISLLCKARVPPHPQTYGTQGTDFTPLQSTGASTPTNVWHTRDRFHSFAKHGCLHTHKRMAHKGQTSLLCKARVLPHPQRTAHKSSTARVWVRSNPRCTEGLQLFVSYVYSSKQTNFGDQGYQSFIDRVIEFHSITS